MSDLKDFEFDAPRKSGDFETGPVDKGPEDGGKGRLLAIGLAVGLAVILLGMALSRWFGREDVVTAPGVEAAADAAPTSPGIEESTTETALDLPELDASDEFIRRLVAELSAHPRLMGWLATDELIRSFTAAIVNISEGTSPKAHLGIMAPAEPFNTASGPGGTHPTEASYARYQPLTEAFVSIDTEGAVQLFDQLEPLIDQAFEELGYPGEDFRRVLLGALDHLLAVPNIEADVALEETVAAYRFADPELESLSAAQKQLLRTGPDNTRRIQRKLRELRRALTNQTAGD